jgi:hypothetical protein
MEAAVFRDKDEPLDVPVDPAHAVERWQDG